MAPQQPHLVHSHAQEGDVPGTVDLRAVEGDDTAYGQVLFHDIHLVVPVN